MNEASTANKTIDDGRSSHSLTPSGDSCHSRSSFTLGNVLFPRPSAPIVKSAVTPPVLKKTSQGPMSLSQSLKSLPLLNNKMASVDDCPSREEISIDNQHSSLSSWSDSPSKQHRSHVRFDETALRRMTTETNTVINPIDSFTSLNLEITGDTCVTPVSPLNEPSPWSTYKRRRLLTSLDLGALDGSSTGTRLPKGQVHQRLSTDDNSCLVGEKPSEETSDGSHDDGLVTGGDSSSSNDEASAQHQNYKEDDEDSPEKLTKQETAMLRFLRIVFYVVLAGVAASAVAVTCQEASSDKSDAFRDHFDEIASQLIENLVRATETKALLASTTASFITELMEAGNMSPINLTLSFSNVAQTPLLASNAASLSWGPLLRTRQELEQLESRLRGRLFRFDDDDSGVVIDESKAPFLPIRFGIMESRNLTLFNQLSDHVRSKTLHQMIATRRPAMSELFIRNGSLYDRVGGVGQPGLIMATPVFLSRDKTAIAGSITSEYKWRNYLGNIANPSFSDLVDIIIENTCGQSYAFRLDHDNELILVAERDMHERKFDEMYQTFDYSDLGQHSTSHSGLNVAACRYRYSIYATSELQAQYQRGNAALTAFVTLSVFLSMAALFIAYDCLVAKRHGKVMEAAKRSTRIVSSLFPKSFRGRLYDEAADGGSVCTRTGSSTAGKSYGGSFRGGDSFTVPCSNSTVSGYTSTKRFRSSCHQRSLLRSFLEASPGDDAPEMEAIADFYSESTVMMLDIQGFTAWSSEREPTMVFKLLETIFRSFDEAAKRFGVFKIETIGDSYVCVTGVPDPRGDHAVAMTRFAFECLKRFSRITKQLEPQLGPSTGDLQARVGMHSGPVTAGVLRGERARFQLFGDTMNTASRMESNGLPGQIQVSEATAELLRLAKKERWLTPRKDLVNAKGKGKMQTYWVSPSREAPRHGHTACSSDDDSDTRESTSHRVASFGETPPLELNHDSIDLHIREACRVSKQMRLVDCNVEILSGFLLNVVNCRYTVGGRPRLARGNSKASLFVADAEARSHATCRVGSALHEVVEAFEMPRFDPKQARRIAETERHALQLDSAVTDQLREYVIRISWMYRDLDYHDFQRASHVTMSAAKLLGRLVKKDPGAGGSNRQMGIEDDRAIHQSTFGISSDPLLQFAVVFAALVHRVDHRGHSNAQLVQTRSPTAVLYKNKSVCEQNSLDVAMAVLMDSDFDQLQSCICGGSRRELRRFRQIVINSVMATDGSDPGLIAARDDKWRRAYGDCTEEVKVVSHQSASRQEGSRLLLSSSSDHQRNSGSKPWQDLKATVLVECIAQASDLAHYMQHWITFCKWSERELLELLASGSPELLVPANPSAAAADVGTATSAAAAAVAKSWYHRELRVFDDRVLPLAYKLDRSGAFGPNVKELVLWATENRKEWEIRGLALAERVLGAATS